MARGDFPRGCCKVILQSIVVPKLSGPPPRCDAREARRLDMQSNDANAAAVNGKEAAYFGVPWEDAYGYAQAIKVGDTIHVSGQFSHDEKGNLIAPASLDDSGKPLEFSMMEQHMRSTYANPVNL